MLIIHDSFESIQDRNCGNQDDIEALRIQHRTNKCCGFIEGDGLHVYWADDVSDQSLFNLFAGHLLDRVDRVKKIAVCFAAWVKIQRLREVH